MECAPVIKNPKLGSLTEQRTFLLFWERISLSNGLQEMFSLFPFRSVRGVVLSPQGFRDVFCMSEDVGNIRQDAVLELKSGHCHFLESISLVRETTCRKIATWKRK